MRQQHFRRAPFVDGLEQAAVAAPKTGRLAQFYHQGRRWIAAQGIH